MSHSKRYRRGGGHTPGRETAAHIAWIPSILGLAVSAYLFGLDLFGGPAVCFVPYGCDAVRSSAYGRIFGVPISAIGVLFFAAALTAYRAGSVWRARPLQFLAAAGAGASLVLVGLQVAVLRTVCPYCLVAELAAFALAYLVFKDVPRASWLGPGLTAGLAVVVLSTIYAMAPPPPANSDYAAGLARHLSESGDVFYGAYWCPHCREQKALFGRAAALLPYVECDPGGNHPQAARCRARGISVYPTWDFHGPLVEGVLTLDDLARRSGFPLSSSGR